MKKLYKEIGLLIVGCLLFSFYISVLLAPNEIGSRGLTGVSLGLNRLCNNGFYKIKNHGCSSGRCSIFKAVHYNLLRSWCYNKRHNQIT